MRINVYAEEITQRIELIEKEIEGKKYTGIRFYLYLPVTNSNGNQISGPFIHRKDDDDSSAITFWGKKQLRLALIKALDLLDSEKCKNL